MHRDLVAEINADAIRHNLRLIRQACRPGVRLCVALKANAYGHGVDVVAPVLDEAGVEMVAVATIGEALELRQLGWTRGILCFGPTFAACTPEARDERIAIAVKYDLTPTVVDGYGLRDLDAEAARRGRVVDYHVKVDTGMGRMGIAPDTAFDLIVRAGDLKHARLAGVYTHLASADEADVEFARHQLAWLTNLIERLAAAGVKAPLVHAANSSAIFMLPESHFDMVRPGLVVYGCRPSKHWPAHVALAPALRLRSHLVLTKQVPAGHSIGYGRTFVTKRPSVIGIVPVGYNDGYARSLSNRGVMGVAGGDAPVVGRVSMDQTVLDLTDLPEARVGDEVTIIDDRPGRCNTVEAIADLLGTVPYEVTCLLGNRVHRVAVCRSKPSCSQETPDARSAVSTPG
ncbi:MAG: alanine racemase [Phycisphaerae bacterium]|nr:alanine racemase [Phycisphaerae bacterium]